MITIKLEPLVGLAPTNTSLRNSPCNYWRHRGLKVVLPRGLAPRASAFATGCAKTPKWHFGRTKKGFSDPSPPKKTRHIETVEVVFPGSPAGEEFSHSLVRRRSVSITIPSASLPAATVSWCLSVDGAT